MNAVDRRDRRWSNTLADIGVALLEAGTYRRAVDAFRLADVVAAGWPLDTTLRRIYAGPMHAALEATLRDTRPFFALPTPHKKGS